MGTQKKEIPEEYFKECIRIAEIYSRVRRWVGLLGCSSPRLDWEQMSKSEVSVMKRDIKDYRDLSEDIRKRFYFNLHIEELDEEADRIHEGLKATGKKLDEVTERIGNAFPDF